jgi:hypothetical protein
MKVTCHSGGAIGADHFWGICSEIAGFDVNHYYYGDRTPYGNIHITNSEYDDGVEHVKLANKALKRKPDNYMHLLARNWMQVKNATAVFAISELVNSRTVAGGTGWAAQMAIDANKPLFVFDQVKNKWFKWDAQMNEFLTHDNVPELTFNFAGIGTRELNDYGREAIREIILNFLINDTTNEIS